MAERGCQRGSCFASWQYWKRALTRRPPRCFRPPDFLTVSGDEAGSAGQKITPAITGAEEIEAGGIVPELREDKQWEIGQGGSREDKDDDDETFKDDVARGREPGG